MRTALILVSWTLWAVLTPSLVPAAELEEQDPAYYHTGELAGSLRSTEPLPLFDADPQHLWNRLFAAVTIRPSLLPSQKEGPPIARIRAFLPDPCSGDTCVWRFVPKEGRSGTECHMDLERLHLQPFDIFAQAGVTTGVLFRLRGQGLI